MDENETLLRKEISINLGCLIEGILTRNAKYSNTPIHEEASRNFYLYCKYESQIPSDLKSRYLKSLIAYGKFFCERKLLGHSGLPFDKRYPENAETRNEYYQWLDSNLKHLFYKGGTVESSLKKNEINKCVKTVIKNRNQDCKLDNKAFGSIGYSKVVGENKIYIIADTGSWRSSISIMIGFEQPKFCIDVSTFFASHQSHYCNGYNSVDDIELSMNKALDLVQSLVPHFINAVESAKKSKI
ncbi:hypothetical protein [Desulfosediminicola flagellatus]|uniref:hypothetical protein n=1 Tax=Desulfosediminicola flagellatus TaxID=2569541 RepID=UPI0010AD299A|nr:hypothetical protein [Desulfosediminicola flagellatus]